ncbi:unnamed protein product, partial [Didymodactylos carnosus]
MNKVELLKLEILKSKSIMIAIVEPWLTSTTDDSQLNLDGY